MGQAAVQVPDQPAARAGPPVDLSPRCDLVLRDHGVVHGVELVRVGVLAVKARGDPEEQRPLSLLVFERDRSHGLVSEPERPCERCGIMATGRGCHAPRSLRLPRLSYGHSGRGTNSHDREECAADSVSRAMDPHKNGGRPAGLAGNLAEQQRDFLGTTEGIGRETVSDRRRSGRTEEPSGPTLLRNQQERLRRRRQCVSGCLGRPACWVPHAPQRRPRGSSRREGEVGRVVGTLYSSGRTYVVPLEPGRALPGIPVGGFQTRSRHRRIPLP